MILQVYDNNGHIGCFHCRVIYLFKKLLGCFLRCTKKLRLADIESQPFCLNVTRDKLGKSRERRAWKGGCRNPFCSFHLFVWKKMSCDDKVSVLFMANYKLTHVVFGVHKKVFRCNKIDTKFKNTLCVNQ